jgi:hypothetical protein
MGPDSGRALEDDEDEGTGVEPLNARQDREFSDQGCKAKAECGTRVEASLKRCATGQSGGSGGRGANNLERGRYEELGPRHCESPWL